MLAIFDENEDGPLEFIKIFIGFYPDLIWEITSKGSDPLMSAPWHAIFHMTPGGLNLWSLSRKNFGLGP